MKHLSIPLTILLLFIPLIGFGQNVPINRMNRTDYCVNDPIMIRIIIEDSNYSYTISHFCSGCSIDTDISISNVLDTIIILSGPTVAGTYQYLINVYDTSLPSSYQLTLGNPTFHPSIDTAYIYADETLNCRGRNIISLHSHVANTGGSIFPYQWKYSTDGSNWIHLGSNTDTVLTLTNYPDSAYYTLVVGSISTPACAHSLTDTILIYSFDTLENNFLIDIDTSSNDPTLALQTNTNSSLTYQWMHRYDSTSTWSTANYTGTTHTIPLTDLGRYTEYCLFIQNPCDTVVSNPISTTDIWNMYNFSIGFVTGGISGDTTVCYGHTLTTPLIVRTLPSFISGARYVWQKKAVSDSIWNTCNSGRYYTPNPAFNDTMYRVQILDPISSNVLYTTDSITIHVYPQLTTPHITANNDTVCYNTLPNLNIDTFAIGALPISYQWQTSNSSSSWTNIVNPNTTPLTTTTLFRVIATDANNCQSISDSLTITVIPPLNIISLSIDLDTSGTNPALTSNVNSSSPSSTYPYQWQHRASPTSRWTPIPNANDSTCVLNLSLAGEYRLIISNGCETDSSNIFNTSSLWISYQISSDTSVCYGIIPNQLTIRPLPNYIQNIRYIWQNRTTASNWIDCGNTNRYQPIVATIDMNYRVSIVRNNPNNDTLFTTDPITIHVYDSIQKPILATTDTIICYNVIPDTIRVTNPASAPPFIYQWQWRNDDDNSWSIISGETNNFYVPTEHLTQDRLYQVIVTNTTTGCNTHSDSLKIAVRKKLRAGNLKEYPNICYSTSVNLTFETSPSGGDENSYSYIWKYSTDSIDFISDTTTLEDHYQTKPIDSTRYYKVVVSSSSCSISESDSTRPIRINVWNFTPARIPSTKDSVCTGTLPPPIAIDVLPQQGSGHYTYQWQSAIDTNSPQNILNATGTTLNLTNPIYQINQTTYYRVLCMDEECLNVEEKRSNWCKIGVKPLPDNQILDDDSPTNNFCHPGIINYSITPINNNNYSYHWELTDQTTGSIKSPYAPSTKIEWYKTTLPKTILQLTTTDNTTHCERKNDFTIIFNSEYVSPDTTEIKKKGQHILICADSTNNAVYIWGKHRRVPYNHTEIRDTIITDKRYHWFEETINTWEWDYFVDISYSKVNHGCDTRTYYNIESEQPNNNTTPASLTVSPNPSQGEVYYTLNQSIDGHCLIQLFDATGHLVYTQECSGYVADTPIKIDTLLKQGIYILSLTSEKIMLNKKIIVQ